jgi:protein O-GlcNAc transferase
MNHSGQASSAGQDRMLSLDELFAHALARHRAGDSEAARRAYADVLARQPNHADALHMAGLLHHQSGEHLEALRLLDAASASAPSSAPILANRAGVHLALAQHAAAESDARAALTADPASFGAAFNLGLALLGLDRSSAAAAAFARASALRPQDARALLEWFSAAVRSSRSNGLAERVRSSLPALAPQRDLALRTAMQLERNGFSNQAFAIVAQLHAELGHDAEISYRFEVESRYRQACAFEYRNDSNSALAMADALIAAAPWHCSARRLRASLLGERGLAADALAEHARVVEFAPDDAKSASAYLIALQHDPAQTAAAIAAAHRAWADRYLPVMAPRWTPERRNADAQRRLRVGWLSPRFFAGLAETFFATELRHLDRTTMAHVLYDSGGIDDAATARFRQAADTWRRVDTLDDEELCARVEADEIDVLVELSGHAPGNRLRALAARPAPVQISWLDYFHSTGTQAIDVLFSDRVLSPPELLHNYSERVACLASGRLAYSPPAGAPQVAPRSEDMLRLACFNRLSKINDEVLATWARLLALLPEAVLKLKMRAFDDTGHRENFIARAATHGISTLRLELLGYGSHVDTLAAYADVDIALDPFPFSGCATSCDALWMGVPVVTRIGESMVSRQTASLLTSLDLSDLIATDNESYVRCVLDLANAVERRRELRSGLRERMQLTIANVERHAHELSGAIRQAWREWCEGESTRSREGRA